MDGGATFGNASIAGSGNINQGGDQRVDTWARPGPGTDPDNDRRPSADRTRNVFVIHGRDEQVRRAIFGLLRQVDLRPLEWEPLVHATGNGTPFLGQVVDGAPTLAQAAVVLLTPDDVVSLHRELHGTAEEAHERIFTMQPRPNVLLELGIVLAARPKNTVILEFGTNLRPIADLGGRNVIRFNEATVTTNEPLRKIVGRLAEAGCPVDDSGTDWLDISPFTDLDAYRRRP
jgi:predicted nucleotide-binding protein